MKHLAYPIILILTLQLLQSCQFTNHIFSKEPQVIIGTETQELQQIFEQIKSKAGVSTAEIVSIESNFQKSDSTSWLSRNTATVRVVLASGHREDKIEEYMYYNNTIIHTTPPSTVEIEIDGYPVSFTNPQSFKHNHPLLEEKEILKCLETTDELLKRAIEESGYTDKIYVSSLKFYKREAEKGGDVIISVNLQHEEDDQIYLSYYFNPDGSLRSES